jgi:serine/threonine protein phosphatase 1
MNSEFAPGADYAAKGVNVLKRFFRFQEKVRPGKVPGNELVYAIGDVHGRLDLLNGLLAEIANDAGLHPRELKRTLVFLGDYIDRGSESRGVLDCLLDDPLPEFAKIYLRGNHEQAMLAFLEGERDCVDWLYYGGVDTFLSYGVPVPGLPRTDEAVNALRSALLKAVPQRHLDFLGSCRLHYTIGDYLFVHAGVRPGIALERQAPADLIWIRDDFLRSKMPLPGRVVVHGHSICDEPQNSDYRINIDTGAFVSGKLTCVSLRGTERRFLSTSGFFT